jgi:hypothetical protein
MLCPSEQQHKFRRITDKILRPAIKHDAAGFQHNDPVRTIQRLRDILLDQDDRLSEIVTDCRDRLENVLGDGAGDRPVDGSYPGTAPGWNGGACRGYSALARRGRSSTDRGPEVVRNENDTCRHYQSHPRVRRGRNSLVAMAALKLPL